MSLHSIFNSLWNMDLTFIVNVSLLILAVLSLAILGYGLLLWIADRLDQLQVCKDFVGKYYNLSDLKKGFVDYMILLLILVPFVIFLFYILSEFLLPMFGLK
jgi:hypothetical protein